MSRPTTNERNGGQRRKPFSPAVKKFRADGRICAKPPSMEPADDEPPIRYPLPLVGSKVTAPAVIIPARRKSVVICAPQNRTAANVATDNKQSKQNQTVSFSGSNCRKCRKLRGLFIPLGGIKGFFGSPRKALFLWLFP